MKLNWNSKISSSISAHLEALIRSERAASDEERTVARTTNALPVYSDLLGTLAFTPEGAILYYNSESGEVTPVRDDAWPVIAAVSAAEKYPDLRGIVPERPRTAKVCSFCSGTGRELQAKAFCGNCSGLGWVC